jgi:hypothetical protein
LQTQDALEILTIDEFGLPTSQHKIIGRFWSTVLDNQMIITTESRIVDRDVKHMLSFFNLDDLSLVTEHEGLTRGKLITLKDDRLMISDSGQLHFYDVSEPVRPRKLDAIEISENVPTDYRVQGTTLWLAMQSEGLMALNLESVVPTETPRPGNEISFRALLPLLRR